MNNNQDDMNRLINELTIQKNKDRKHLLRIEIAKVFMNKNNISGEKEFLPESADYINQKVNY